MCSCMSVYLWKFWKTVIFTFRFLPSIRITIQMFIRTSMRKKTFAFKHSVQSTFGTWKSGFDNFDKTFWTNVFLIYIIAISKESHPVWVNYMQPRLGCIQINCTIHFSFFLQPSDIVELLSSYINFIFLKSSCV